MEKIRAQMIKIPVPYDLHAFVMGVRRPELWSRVTHLTRMIQIFKVDPAQRPRFKDLIHHPFFEHL